MTPDETKLCRATPPTSGEAFYIILYRDTPNAGSEDFAKQLLVLIGTLVTSVASFYFGAKAVSEARNAVGGISQAPTLIGIDPNAAKTGETLTLRALGSNLNYVGQLQLTMAPHSITATTCTSNEGRVEAEVRIPVDAPEGSWDVVVADKVGRTATLEKAMMISKKIASDGEQSNIPQSRTEQANEPTKQVEHQLADDERSRFDALCASIDPLLAATSAVVAAAPTLERERLTEELTKVRAALETAKTSGKPDQVAAALEALKAAGPIASLIQELGPVLGPLVPAGTTVAALRALAETTAKLPPSAVLHWTARLLAAPYRDDLITPPVDAGYAQRLLASVPGAGNLLQFLQDHAPKGPAAAVSPLNELAFVNLVLRESAISTINDIWGADLETNPASTVEAIQRRALEMQLESEIAIELMQPYGSFQTFWQALEGVQTRPDGVGMRALDLFLMLVRAAREAGVATLDLLPV